MHSKRKIQGKVCRQSIHFPPECTACYQDALWNEQRKSWRTSLLTWQIDCYEKGQRCLPLKFSKISLLSASQSNFLGYAQVAIDQHLILVTKMVDSGLRFFSLLLFSKGKEMLVIKIRSFFHWLSLYFLVLGGHRDLVIYVPLFLNNHITGRRFVCVDAFCCKTQSTSKLVRAGVLYENVILTWNLPQTREHFSRGNQLRCILTFATNYA